MSLILRQGFKKMWKQIGEEDQKRIEKLILPKGVKYRSFWYEEDKDPLHTLSIYHPSNYSDDLPVIIDIHGGGWMYGSKEINRPFDMYMASLGFAVVGLSYRLAPHVRFAEMIHDIDSAVRKAYAVRFDFPMDFSKAVLTGDSAGGQLAGVYAALQESEDLRRILGVEKLPFTIKGINFNHTVPYMDKACYVSKSKIFNRMANHELLLEVFGPSSNKKNRDLFKAVGDFKTLISPLSHFPAAHILTSTGDGFSFQSHLMEKDLIDKGFDVKLVEYPQRHHVFNIGKINDPESIKANKQIAEFFLRAVGD